MAFGQEFHLTVVRLARRCRTAGPLRRPLLFTVSREYLATSVHYPQRLPMKSLLVVTAAVVFLVSPRLWAQERFFLGATAGATSTKLSGDMRQRLVHLKDRFQCRADRGVRPLGRYSPQCAAFIRDPGYGSCVRCGEVDPRDSLELTLDYVSIPVFARFLAPGRTWFVNGGLDLGFLLKGSLKNVPADRTVDVKDLLNNVDLMMIIGVGGTIHLDPALLTIELRYGQSLINAGSNDQLAAKIGIPPRFRSTGFQLLAGVMYPL